MLSTFNTCQTIVQDFLAHCQTCYLIDSLGIQAFNLLNKGDYRVEIPPNSLVHGYSGAKFESG